MNDSSEMETIVEAWLTYWESPDNSPERDAVAWVNDRLLDWRMHGDPEHLWRFIQEIYPRSMSGSTFSILAAGPLEDLLVEHGPAYIERVEELARTDGRFNDLLGGVWQNAMTEEIWSRVQAARKKVW